MGDIDPDKFSELTNALQAALFLARERVADARANTAEADQLHRAVARAADAAGQLRQDNGQKA